MILIRNCSNECFVGWHKNYMLLVVAWDKKQGQYVNLCVTVLEEEACDKDTESELSLHYKTHFISIVRVLLSSTNIYTYLHI